MCDRIQNQFYVQKMFSRAASRFQYSQTSIIPCWISPFPDYRFSWGKKIETDEYSTKYFFKK